ncbi:Scytalone dehydratase [Penicillium macrosclerotiorum]|uniref:Scytalone dehydratase n=1 Tax=Penicillium macrosclerotiorum TaxID=303699 RepID=UPI0025480189|nr:Scytalone dehydratase [Penicillium macrosclerotiorum]KAJ5676020.1 Scytalone dehydratase [Penicillium macrosclerotiorum]
MENIQFKDYLAVSRLVFEWADSYDSKDWDRLRKILAPSLMIDYTIVGHKCFPDMESEEFVSMMSSPDFLGDPLVKTQHLMGAVGYEWVSDTEIIATHQIRAAHQRYEDPDLTTVAYRGHGNSTVTHWYKKINGDWKLSGVRPKIYWNEYDFDKIFPNLSAEH